MLACGDIDGLMRRDVMRVLRKIKIENANEIGRAQLGIVVAALHLKGVVAGHVILYPLLKAIPISDLQLHVEFAPILISRAHGKDARLALGHGREEKAILDRRRDYATRAFHSQNRIQERNECHCLFGVGKDPVEGYIVLDIDKSHVAHV